MKSILITLSLVLFGFAACEKENDKAFTPKKPVLDFVLSGEYDTGYIYKLISPSILLIENEIACLQTGGSVRLDIDTDNKFDIIFRSFTATPDFGNQCCGCPPVDTIICDCFPTGSINKYAEIIDSTFQIAVKDDSYIGCLSAGDTVDNSLKWRNKSSLWFLSDNFFPEQHKYGYWLSDEYKYMGIRKTGTDTIYGWISLNVKTTIEIKEIYLGIKKGYLFAN